MGYISECLYRICFYDRGEPVSVGIAYPDTLSSIIVTRHRPGKTGSDRLRLAEYGNCIDIYIRAATSPEVEHQERILRCRGESEVHGKFLILIGCREIHTPQADRSIFRVPAQD